MKSFLTLTEFLILLPKLQEKIIAKTCHDFKIGKRPVPFLQIWFIIVNYKYAQSRDIVYDHPDSCTIKVSLTSHRMCIHLKPLLHPIVRDLQGTLMLHLRFYNQVLRLQKLACKIFPVCSQHGYKCIHISKVISERLRQVHSL